jgi:hypothetical protein
MELLHSTAVQPPHLDAAQNRGVLALDAVQLLLPAADV